MLSDKDFEVRETTLKPLVEKLQHNLLHLRVGKDTDTIIPYTRTLVAQLEPFANQEAFAFLRPMIAEAKEFLAGRPLPSRPPDKTLMLNIFILIILVAGPIFVGLMGRSLVVIGLLTLPVLGWFYIGIYAYLRDVKKIRDKK
jgi:hypothetical protein